jgi:hypothetical protein
MEFISSVVTLIFQVSGHFTSIQGPDLGSIQLQPSTTNDTERPEILSYDVQPRTIEAQSNNASYLTALVEVRGEDPHFNNDLHSTFRPIGTKLYRTLEGINNNVGVGVSLVGEY